METAEGLKHTPEFRRRRFMNWFPLGLMYASFYMGRYNLSVANPHIRAQFGWGKEEFGWIITLGLLVYGIAVFFNGPWADRVGGRRAILIGAVGTTIFNVIFGIGIWTPYIAFFSVAYGFNMYFQTFGALSVVKVNAAWFHISERGTFAGIFGAMIQFGRVLAYGVGGFIVARLPWEWAFWVPAMVLAAVFVLNFIFVRDTPEQLGFPRVDDVLEGEEEGEKPTIKWIIKRIFTNPTLLIIAGAMMCTGLVRHTIEQWGPSYFIDVHQVTDDSFIYQFCFQGTVVVGILGALVMGRLSDKLFQSRRGPVTAIAYFLQAVLLLAFAFIITVPSEVKTTLASANNDNILKDTTLSFTSTLPHLPQSVSLSCRETKESDGKIACDLASTKVGDAAPVHMAIEPDVTKALLRLMLRSRFWEASTVSEKEKTDITLTFKNKEGEFALAFSESEMKSNLNLELMTTFFATVGENVKNVDNFKSLKSFQEAMKPAIGRFKDLVVPSNTWFAAIIIIILYFFLNGCHGLLAGTASMDFGGRKAAASAAGLLDGCQYLAGSLLVGPVMGRLLDKLGWDYWAYTIIPIAILGGILMATRWNILPSKAKRPAH